MCKFGVCMHLFLDARFPLKFSEYSGRAEVTYNVIAVEITGMRFHFVKQLQETALDVQVRHF